MTTEHIEAIRKSRGEVRHVIENILSATRKSDRQQLQNVLLLANLRLSTLLPESN